MRKEPKASEKNLACLQIMAVLLKETGIMLGSAPCKPAFYKGRLYKDKKAIHMKNRKRYLTYSLKMSV